MIDVKQLATAIELMARSLAGESLPPPDSGDADGSLTLQDARGVAEHSVYLLPSKFGTVRVSCSFDDDGQPVAITRPCFCALSQQEFDTTLGDLETELTAAFGPSRRRQHEDDAPSFVWEVGIVEVFLGARFGGRTFCTDVLIRRLDTPAVRSSTESNSLLEISLVTTGEQVSPPEWLSYTTAAE